MDRLFITNSVFRAYKVQLKFEKIPGNQSQTQDWNMKFRNGMGHTTVVDPGWSHLIIGL